MEHKNIAQKPQSVRLEQTAADLEKVDSNHDSEGNLVYDNEDVEPELRTRTYIVILAFFMLHFVQIMALQGPPAVLAFIGRDLNATAQETWIPNALSLVQAVLGPILCSASDAFQARKTIIVVSCLIAFIGSAIAPGSQDLSRLIAGTVLIGVGFAAVPLSYTVPSEVVPRKWYPIVQGLMNVASAFSAIASPLAIGALTRSDPVNGWRNFYWIQMALWGAIAVAILAGYRPPKRHTRLDHLSFWQKLGQLDLIGFFLLLAGLTLFLVGMNLGGQYAWSSSRVLGTLVVGLVGLVAFGVYEAFGTKTGIMHHDFFKGKSGRTFAICAALIFIEGIMLFAWVIFYPQLTGALFETDPFLIAARGQSFWVASVIASGLFGYVSTRFRTVRPPMSLGYLLWTCGLIGLATIQPGDSTSAIAFSGLSGLGFSSPLVLIVSTVQLVVPHHLIATATAVITSARSIASTIFTAIFTAAAKDRAKTLVPAYIVPAVVKAGLPPRLAPALVASLASHNQTAVAGTPGLTPEILDAAVAAFKQAQADAIRVVFEIAAPFGALACILCFFLGDLKKLMNYRVNAPVETLRSKHTG